MQYDLFERYASAITALPQRAEYAKAELQAVAFQLQRDGNLAIYYAPFDHVNPYARVALVGITPGWTQMEIAYRVAREGLLERLSYPEILRRAKSQASFAGPMRKNLCSMLDGIGLPEQLGIESSISLFEEHSHLVHTTSAVRYPVFKGGANYTGRTPSVTKHHLLRCYLMTFLRAELEAMPQALVIALGDCVTQALSFLVENGDLDAICCLLGFPHPSGGNGHRKAQYEQRKDQLKDKVRAWFAQEPSLAART